ncbi:MAG: lipoyltransferase [Bacteroides sp.]|nr:lipoyltransferase [Bacteroides sp.]
MSILLIKLPHTGPQRLPFYLAAEEWIARNLPSGEYFFAWQVAPTVICGRHQDAACEIDLGYCVAHNIEVYRRKSGGGAVYADMNNIMFSYVGPAASIENAFARYTSRVADALRTLGLDAATSGRNDIVVDGRKVAGNAYWRCGDRCIVHGTMLYDADESTMSRALTPSRAKLMSHKVVSVQSRITTVISRLPGLSINEFLDRMLSYVCDGEAEIPSTALPEIRAIEKEYYAETFSSVAHGSRGIRITGVGDININVVLSGDVIDEVRLSGDFFSGQDVSRTLERLRGLPCREEAIAGALGKETIISSLDNSVLAGMIAAGHKI